MKEFNFEQAKAGKPVCTRNGLPVRILCFDANVDGNPIVALVGKDKEKLSDYPADGQLFLNSECALDLMMVGEKREGWMNIYASRNGYTPCGHIFPDKYTARLHGRKEDYVTTIKVTWEE